MEQKEPPPYWGKDAISKYLDACRNNQFATFYNKRSEVIDLITIEGMLRKLSDGAINPRPVLPIGFFQRSHSSYLAAISATLGGQLHELQTLLRACLEQAGYGFYVGDDQGRWERWMNRHDDEASRKAVRREFTHARILDQLKRSDARLAEVYAQLYEQTIDFGAHPNERGASMSSEILDLPDGGKEYRTIYLHGNGLALDFSLKATSQVGIAVLQIARKVYPNRFKAIGIEATLRDITTRF